MKCTLCALFIIISISSCTKVLYINEQVLNNLHDKNEVIAKFGLPTEKNADAGYTQWVYSFGDVSITSNNTSINTNVDVSSDGKHKSAGGGITNSSYSNQYSKFIKYTFNTQDKVVNVISQGVNYTKRVPSKGRTIALAGIGVAIILTIIIGSKY